MKKYLSAILILSGALALVSCGNRGSRIDDKEIIVGASPTPHAEILEQTRSYIESKGYTLTIVKYTDYILPNVGVSEGELDANFFQHFPYLNNYNEKNGSSLISVGTIHYEPLGFYGGKRNSLEDLQNAVIGIPNDSTNKGRSLLLLEALGILDVDDSKGFDVTQNDIKENKYNISIQTFEAAALPAQLSEVDFAVINGNYALSNNIDASKKLGNESAESVAAKTYGNIVAVQKGNENKEAITILMEALRQESVSNYIRNTYAGVALPMN